MLLFADENVERNFFEQILDFFKNPKDVTLSAYQRILIAVAFIIVFHFFVKLVTIIMKKVLKVKKAMNVDVSAKLFIINFTKIILYIFEAFLVIGILGLNIEGFAGIISAITVAIGLAIQDIIGMFASGLLLLREKNFKTGDHIQVTNSFGTVEGEIVKIGVLLTKLITFDGELVVLANNTVTKSNIINFTAYKSRRLIVEVPLLYGTDIDAVRDIIKEAISKDERILKEPNPRIALEDFDDYRLTLKVKVWISQPEYWNVYYDIRELIYSALVSNNIKLATKTTISIDKEQ